METLELSLAVPETLQEFLIAELADLRFEGFVQEPETLKAYIDAEHWDADRQAFVTQWLTARKCPTEIHVHSYAQQDWNATWEATIEPIQAGPFVVKPTWKPLPEVWADKIVLEIDPKMSFGTGHHETTRLVLGLMPDYVPPGARVLDAGTGTGVLGIAALKLGAAAVEGFDIDPWVEENVLENVRRNDVARRFRFAVGTLDSVEQPLFDLILANINRNVLVAYLPGFAERMAPGARLILAGLLTTDRTEMLVVVNRTGLVPIAEATENDWWSVVLVKR